MNLQSGGIEIRGLKPVYSKYNPEDYFNDITKMEGHYHA